MVFLAERAARVVGVEFVEHLRSLLRPGARTLLVSFDYDQSEMSGPPFAVPDEEVDRLFSPGFEVELLESRDVPGDQFRSRGLTAMTESAFVLTRKSGPFGGSIGRGVRDDLRARGRPRAHRVASAPGHGQDRSRPVPRRGRHGSSASEFSLYPKRITRL